MENKMVSKLIKMKRFLYSLAALVFFAGLSLSVLLPGAASAAQVTSRSIEMSSSTPSATNVTYKVTFTPGTSITNPDMIIDFCSNSPIIGDSCTATAGTDTPNFTGASAGGSWTLTTIGSGRGVKLTTSSVSFTGGTPVTITLTGVTNPSDVGTFYGRILTYLNGGAGSNTSASPGTYQDYGGIALSTVTAISITAKVMEQLTFCASAADLSSSDCTSATTPALTLGHAVGSATVLTSGQVDTASAYTQLSTNALSGAIVRMKTDNTCSTGAGGLSSSGTASTTCGIPGIGSNSTMAAGTADFGMCVAPGSNTTVAATYADTSGGHCPTSYGASVTYGMNGTNVESTYGDQVFSTSGPVSKENNTCTFAATASLTTPAGIYTADESLIATGTF